MKKAAFLTGAMMMFVIMAAPVSAETDYGANPTTEISDPTPEPGETVTLTGKGAPNAEVVATMNLSTPSGSTVTVAGSSAAAPAQDVGNTAPITLGSTTADGNGDFSLSFTVPTGITCGTYVLTVTVGGTATVNNSVPVSSSCTAAAATGGSTDTGTNAAPSPQLALTGVETGGLAVIGGALLAGGLMLVGKSRRYS